MGTTVAEPPYLHATAAELAVEENQRIPRIIAEDPQLGSGAAPNGSFSQFGTRFERYDCRAMTTTCPPSGSRGQCA
jgi:hypothetical protein